MFSTVFTLAIAAAAAVEPYPSLSADGGFSADAGPQVLDQSNADAGRHTASVSPRVSVHITGAKVMPPEVYLDLIHLPDEAAPDEQTAAVVRQQLFDFLLRTGFELATVAAHPSARGIEVDLDEGQIERVLFLGQLSYQQVRFKLALLLPNDVFNRPLLDRQVRELSDSLHLPGVRWELVQTGEVVHHGPQVTELPGQMAISLQGDEVIHERRPYEVHIVFPETEGSGPGIDLRTSYLDGLELGPNVRLDSLLLDGDRLWAAASGGVAFRERLDTDRLYAQFSRAVLQTRYQLFPLFEVLRPNLWGEVELVSRQRRDLDVENYDALTIDGALQADLKVWHGLDFNAGVGFEWRRLFGFQGTAAAPISPDVRLTDRKRPFFRFTQEAVFAPEVLRWDRRHTLYSELRIYMPVADQPLFAWADLRYQYVRSIGWHDAWVRGRGHLAWGDVSFHDQVSVGEFLRGLFGNQYTPAAIALQLEFRFSIIRDILKLSVFHDLAMFAVQPVRGDPKLLTQLADGFGPGVHFLVQDMFQVDTYAAFGFRRGGVFGFAFSLQLQRAF